MTQDSGSSNSRSPRDMDRRGFSKFALAALAGVALVKPGPGSAAAEPAPGSYLASLRRRPLSIGMLMFERMDQIDFTGPFSVLSRVPDATVSSIGIDAAAVRDHKGLILTPEVTLSDATRPDVLVVPGGPGQEALMDNALLIDAIAAQQREGRALFSVCTGALLLGAAGVLQGKRATTHWSAFSLLSQFGAEAVNERVVVDGDLVTAAGVTAGIDGALQLAALLRSPRVAQEIQLDIQYAPEPPYDSGTPETAAPEVFEAVSARFRPLMEARAETARRFEESWRAR